jgi:hypothetical protein
MFNAWRYPTNRQAAEGRQPAQNGTDDAQVSQLRRMLQELRGGPDDPEGPSEPESTEVAGEPLTGQASPDIGELGIAAPIEPVAEGTLNGSVETGVGSERRNPAETLLERVAAFEEQVKAQALIVKADEEHDAALAKAEALDRLERKAQTTCEALIAQRDEVERRKAQTESELATARSHFETLQAEALQMEEKLQEVQRRATEAAATLDRSETKGRELDQNQASIESDISLAQERLGACHLKSSAARTEAETAGGRADALRSSLSPQGGASISLQQLALRIVEDAAALEKKKSR